MTMLVVSHEMLFVREVATRVVFMEGGRIAEQGPPDDLLVNPKSERLASFLGRFHGVFR
jgi:polar amino acid transport system ATP-binding protein